jgi:murein L,D-transpeptidase YafK
MRILTVALLLIQATRRDTEHVTRIVIEKSARKMTLLANGNVVREYRVALGGQPVGPKQQQGDHKTPEGLYTVDYKQPASTYHRALISPIRALRIVRRRESWVSIRAGRL